MLFHNFSLSRSLVVDAAEMQHADKGPGEREIMEAAEDKALKLLQEIQKQ